jgi:hypothetical protein
MPHAQLGTSYPEVTAASVISSARSMMANDSFSCASVMQSGGFEG